MANTRDISFGTFNLYNLQVAGKPMYRADSVYSDEEYRAKVDWSARLLRLLDADIVGFQELWSAQALRDILTFASLTDDCELVFIKDEWYTIAVAAIVRKPWVVRAKKVHKQFPEELRIIKRSGDPHAEGDDDDIDVKIDMFSRSILQLTVGRDDVDDVPDIEVFCCHFKSKRPTRLDYEEYKVDAIKKHSVALGGALSTIRRTAESAALRIILTNQLKGTDKPAVVLGDLNDGQESNTLGILTQQPPYRLYEKSGRGSSNDVGLYSASMMHEIGSFYPTSYTHAYQGVPDIIDHVLFSEQFYDHSKNRLWSFRDMKVWNDHVEDDTRSTSDHAQVAAYFDYNRA